MITTDEYGRKCHKCSKCNEFCRKGAEQCRACRNADLDASRQTMSKGKVYPRTIYKCQTCGKEKYSNYPRCWDCAKKAGAFRGRVAKPRFCTCGKQLSDIRSKMCRQCDQERRNAQAQEIKHRKCKDCGGTPDGRTRDGRCRGCYSKFRQNEYARQNGEPPPDHNVIAAAKFSRRQKKCPTCGVKITTRECVACAVLNRVGEKGFR